MIVYTNVDIDECSNATLNNCDIYATCNNTIGNFSCECLVGFEGDGIHCRGIQIIIVVEDYNDL